MTHKEIINIKETIGHWANNCGGCETCEREFGGKEEPTFDMQTVFEICAVYTDALKMLEEMAFALETTMAFGNGLVAQTTIDKYRKFKEGIK